jgi:hypothetical protein
MRRLAYLLAATALAGIGGTANADPLNAPNDPEGVNRAIITARTEIIYDSNVARSSAAEAAARHLKPEDESIWPAVEFDLVRAIGTQSLFLKGSAGYDFYARNHVLNAARADVAGGGELRLRPCRVVLMGDYATQQRNLEEITGQAVNNQETTTTAGLDGDCARPIGFTPTLTVVQVWSANSNPQLVNTDYRSFHVSGGLAYQRPSLGRVSLFGEYTKTLFPNRNVIFLVGPVFHVQEDGYQVWSSGLRFDHKLGGRIDLDALAAYTSVKSAIPGGLNFGGVTYLADGVFHATGRLSAQAHFERATQPSVLQGSSLAVQDQYSGEVDFALSPRLQLSSGAMQFNQSFQGPGVNPAIDLTRARTFSYFGAATLTLGRRFSIAVDARNENRHANLERYSYNSTRVSLTLGAHL